MAQVIAGGHFSAEAVAAVQDGHLRRIVGRGLHEHRNVEAGEAKSVGDGALVAEVGKRDDHAIDTLAIFLKQGGAAFRLVVSLDGAVFAFFGSKDHTIDAGQGERLDHFFASRLRQLAGKKSAVPDDDAHRHFLLGELLVRHKNSSSTN